MTANPPDLRPDLAPAARLGDVAARPGQPRIGMVSLGCPKALVDSERILTRLRAEGYAISPDYEGADAVVVNTCGFLDSAKAESLEAIGEALARDQRLILVITGKGGKKRSDDDAPFMREGEGVLRQQAPRWLRSGPHAARIVGIYQAHPRHGGAGAFYVYLKKRR